MGFHAAGYWAFSYSKMDMGSQTHAMILVCAHCSAHEIKMGTDKSAQVLIQRY